MKLFLSVLLLVVYSSVAIAQDLDIPVFRGEIAEKYTYPLEGTVYDYSDEFEVGSVEFNGKYYHDLMLNLNAHRGELQVKIGSAGESVALKRSLVGKFNIGDRNYTALFADRKIPGLEEGYYQVLYAGEDLLLKHIHKSTHDGTVFITGNIIKVFVTKCKYWLVKNGKVLSIRKERDLLGIYKEKRETVKHYMRLHKDTESERDKNFSVLMSLIEQTN